MRKITEPVKMGRATNCTGPDEIFEECDSRVELSDIGVTLNNYGGHKHTSYKFEASDVGRTIRDVRQGFWYHCWYFLPKEKS